MIRITENMPKLQAHHVLPREFAKWFAGRGFDINNSVFGSWVDPTKHAKFSHAYNTAWQLFIDKTPNATNIQLCKNY